MEYDNFSDFKKSNLNKEIIETKSIWYKKINKISII
jgi:hypothetical protein